MSHVYPSPQSRSSRFACLLAFAAVCLTTRDGHGSVIEPGFAGAAEPIPAHGPGVFCRAGPPSGSGRGPPIPRVQEPRGRRGLRPDRSREDRLVLRAVAREDAAEPARHRRGRARSLPDRERDLREPPGLSGHRRISTCRRAGSFRCPASSAPAATPTTARPSSPIRASPRVWPGWATSCSSSIRSARASGSSIPTNSSRAASASASASTSTPATSNSSSASSSAPGGPGTASAPSTTCSPATRSTRSTSASPATPAAAR